MPKSTFSLTCADNISAFPIILGIISNINMASWSPVNIDINIRRVFQKKKSIVEEGSKKFLIFHVMYVYPRLVCFTNTNTFLSILCAF